MDDPTELEWELKRAQERISRLEKDVSRLYGQLLGVAACVVLKQPPELDQDAAKAQLHHLADREPSAAIDPEYLEPAENAIAKIATVPRQRGRRIRVSSCEGIIESSYLVSARPSFPA